MRFCVYVLIIEIIFKKVNATNTVYLLSMTLCELKFNSVPYESSIIIILLL